MMGAGYGQISTADKDCVSNPERELARLDDRLAEIEGFGMALGKFLSSSVRHSILDSREEHTSLYAIYGAIMVYIPQLHTERLHLIERIEEQPAQQATPLFQVREDGGEGYSVGFVNSAAGWVSVFSFYNMDEAEKRAALLNGGQP